MNAITNCTRDRLRLSSSSPPYQDVEVQSDTENRSEIETLSEKNVPVDKDEIIDLEDLDTHSRPLSAVLRVHSPNTSNIMTTTQSVALPSTSIAAAVAGTSNENVPDVPQEILDILGEARKIEQALGDKVPTEISERWGKILVDGLSKEQKESLIDKMLIPENFLLARAPKLNPEIVAVLTDAVKNRDKRLERAQNQLGSGLAGLVTLTKDLITSDMSKLNIIKRISEISQILLDLHHDETMNRRKLILPLLDKKFWTTIQGAKRENFLFGDKLGENIRSTKDIEKSSQQIKKPISTQAPFQRRHPSGNARGPPRQQGSGKAPATSRYHDAQPAAAARRTNTQQQRARQTSFSRSQDKKRR